MLVVREFGRTLMDREALAEWTKRSVATIRARCTPVGYDKETGRALYDADQSWALLEVVPARRRVAV